jgi:hypothetical protein
VANGSKRIFNNREFCGLSISDFVDYTVDGDLSGKMLNGLVRTVLTMEFSPEVTQLSQIKAYQIHFDELFERFMRKNEDLFRQHFAAIQLEAKQESETAHLSFDNVSNF